MVFFCLLGSHPIANLRHYAFMIEGLADTEQRLARRQIGFAMRRADGSNPLGELTEVCRQTRPALVVLDENPLRASARWRVAAAQGLDVPVLSVDADVVVPSAIIGREQYAARTIRPRIHAHLGRFLKPVGNQVARVPWRARPRDRVTKALARVAFRTRNRSLGAAGGGVSRRHHGGAARA